MCEIEISTRLDIHIMERTCYDVNSLFKKKIELTFCYRQFVPSGLQWTGPSKFDNHSSGNKENALQHCRPYYCIIIVCKLFPRNHG